MQYGVDPLALAVALVAIWFTWMETRRNNRTILKVLDCKGSSEMSIETQGRIVDKFEIWIQNRGISLHGVAVAMSFTPKDGCGRCNLPLRRSSKYDMDDSPEFARGMVGKFYLKSNEIREEDMFWFRMLKNPTTQDTKLNVYSQDYLAYSLRIGGFKEKAKSKWNRFAFWFNNLFTHEHGKNPEGMPIIHMPEILPHFVTIENAIVYFIDQMMSAAERSSQR